MVNAPCSLQATRLLHSIAFFFFKGGEGCEKKGKESLSNLSMVTFDLKNINLPEIDDCPSVETKRFSTICYPC